MTSLKKIENNFRSEEQMRFLKRLLNVVSETPETKVVTVAVSSEELNDRLKEFDNQTLLNQIKTLEKIVSFLAKKIEIQSEVIRRQSEAIKDIHTTIEEIANVFEAVQKNTVINSVSTQNEDEDEDEETGGLKKYIN